MKDVATACMRHNRRSSEEGRSGRTLRGGLCAPSNMPRSPRSSFHARIHVAVLQLRRTPFRCGPNVPVKAAGFQQQFVLCEMQARVLIRTYQGKNGAKHPRGTHVTSRGVKELSIHMSTRALPASRSSCKWSSALMHDHMSIGSPMFVAHSTWGRSCTDDPKGGVAGVFGVSSEAAKGVGANTSNSQVQARCDLPSDCPYIGAQQCTLQGSWRHSLLLQY